MDHLIEILVVIVIILIILVLLFLKKRKKPSIDKEIDEDLELEERGLL